MSSGKRKARADVDDWMSQLDIMASNAKKPGGNRHLFRLSSFPAELLRDGASIEWKPFSFRIHEIGTKKSKSMKIIEDGVDGAKPVEVRLGTQPLALIQSKNLSEDVLHCKEYSVTDFQDRPQLFIWKMETSEMIEKARVEHKRWDRQVRLPIVRLKKKRRKRKFS